MLLNALLYYLDNLWDLAEGGDKKKQGQFNARTSESLRNWKHEMPHKVEMRGGAKNRVIQYEEKEKH